MAAELPSRIASDIGSSFVGSTVGGQWTVRDCVADLFMKVNHASPKEALASADQILETAAKNLLALGYLREMTRDEIEVAEHAAKPDGADETAHTWKDKYHL